MRIDIRPIRDEDAERVSEMAAALSAHEGQPPPPFSPADIRRHAFGSPRRFEGLVADTGKDLVGYVLFTDSFNVGIGTPGLHMLDLYVEPDHRRHGTARRLMAAISRICVERDGTWITWQSLPSNYVAIDFYDIVGGRRYRAANFELSGRALSDLAGRR